MTITDEGLQKLIDGCYRDINLFTAIPESNYLIVHAEERMSAYQELQSLRKTSKKLKHGVEAAIKEMQGEVGKQNDVAGAGCRALNIIIRHVSKYLEE